MFVDESFPYLQILTVIWILADTL